MGAISYYGRRAACAALVGALFGVGVQEARSAAGTEQSTGVGVRSVGARPRAILRRPIGGAIGSRARPAGPVKTGVVRVDYPEFHSKLLGPTGTREVSGQNGEAMLPAGSYTLLEWTLWARGKEGRRWKATGGMGARDLVIRTDRVADLRLASPLKLQWGPATMGNPHRIELLILGTSGEQCTGVTVEGATLPAPRFEVRDAAGERVGGGDIHFCCKFRASAEWVRDASAKGQFTLSATADWGPFPVAMERPLVLDVKTPSAPAPFAAVGAPAPDLRLPATEGGGEVALADLRDRPVLLCFFCGCGPCLEVARGIAHLPGAHLVAIVTDAASFRGEALRRFRATSGFRGPVLLDGDGAIGRRYRTFSCPRVWLVDREGRLAFDSHDPHVAPSQIIATVTAALAPLRSEQISEAPPSAR